MSVEEEKKLVVKKNWKEIAEVRMLMYVIPVAVTLAVVGLVLSQCSYR